MSLPEKAVVTGGAGFIGSHLVERLQRAGVRRIAVVDDLSSGRPENLAAARARGGVELVVADVADREAIAPAFAGAGWVFHLAGKADIVPSIDRPVDYFETNVRGTLTVLECARACGVQRLVYAASSSCYGIPDVYPTPEEAPIRPQYPYALTKRLGEELVLHWGQVYGLPVVSLRLFNVYGPRARTSGAYGAVFGVFLAQRANGRPLTVVGDGTQTRDFTYVTDVVEAFLAAAREPAAVGEVFNVGSGGHYSINRLAELIGGEVVQLPKRPGEPDCTFADIGKIRRLLGWRPRVPFEEGVRRMLEGLEAWREAPVWDAEGIRAATRNWFRYLAQGEERPC